MVQLIQNKIVIENIIKCIGLNNFQWDYMNKDGKIEMGMEDD